MSYKGEFTEVYNYLSDCCKDPIITTPDSPNSDFRWKDRKVSTGVIIQYKGEAKVVKIPKGVIEIGSRKHYVDGEYDSDGSYGCFEKCTLTDVILPKSLKKIGSCAFFKCFGLKSIDIPNSVTSIGYGAFSHCYNLTSINISNSVTSIGSNAFNHCINLNSIVIPDGVTSIDNYVFVGCENLKSIVIPDGVTSIGTGAFLGSGLTSIICSAYLDLSAADVPEDCEVIRR